MEDRRNMKVDDVSAIDGVVILILISPLYFLFAYYGQPFRGFVAALSAGVILSLIRLLRRLILELRFWLLLITIIVLHIVLVYFLPYTGEFRFGFALFPLVVLDIYISARLILFACDGRQGPRS